jgi:WD40 repeat protein
MTQVFLCYSDKDKEVMKKLAKTLMREGFTVWTNKTDIKTGTEFQEEVNKGIEGADNVVCLISPVALQSWYWQQEIAHAFANNKRIIPLLIEPTELDSIHPNIRALQFIDFTTHQDEAKYRHDADKFVKILHQDERYYEEYKSLLVKALKWQEQNRNHSILLRGHNLQYYEHWLKVHRHRGEHPPLPLQIEFITSSSNQPPESSLEVFISYSRADSDFARKLNEALQIQGKTTWFDQESIPPGSDFQQEIYRGIESSANFLFIISPKSVNSPYCADEVEYAQKLNKRFVTVLHRHVSAKELHPALASVQWIDFNRYGGDFYPNFSELVRTLDTDREHVKSHTKWSQRALEWENKDKSADLLLRGSEFLIAQNWLHSAEQENKQPTATDLQKQYISKSGRYKRKNRRLLIGAFVSVMGVVTTAGIVSTALWLKAERQAAIAKAELVKNLLLTNPLEGLVQSIEATGSSRALLSQVPPWEVQSSLFEAIKVARKGIIERNILREPEAEVLSVAISPNGLMIASGDASGTVRLWDIHGKPIGQPFRGHEHGVLSVAFSPNGRYIVSGSDDYTVRLWDIYGKPIGQPFRGHEYRVTSVAFSPDGQTIVSGSLDNTVRLWDLEGNQIGQAFGGHESSVTSVAFSPDGQTIVSGSTDTTVRLWDLKGNQIDKPFRGHQGSVDSVAFSPDGRYIVSGSVDKRVRLWNRKGNPIGHPFRGHESSVTSVAFSSDGQTIVSGSTDTTVRLWDLNGNPIGKSFRGHQGSVTSVAFSSDEQTIVSGSDDKTVRLWDRKGNPMGQPFQGHRSSVTSVAFSPNGQTIVSGCYDRKVRLWDRKGNLIGQPFQGHEAGIWSVAFSPNGQMIASGSEDKTVRLWDLKGNPIGHPFRGHQGTVGSVAFNPNGQLIATGSDDKTVRLWDLKGNPIGHPFTGHQDKVHSVAFSPDGKIIASASEDKTVQLWDLKGNLIGQPLRAYKNFARSVAFSLDGKYIVTGGDNTILLWNRQGKRIGQPFSGHKRGVFSVAFSPDAQYIVSGSHDQTVRLWDLKGNPIGQPLEHEAGVWSVAFSPDGQTIVSGSGDEKMWLWQGGTWKTWLQIACDRLRDHSVLKNPQTEVAKRAHETCQR